MSRAKVIVTIKIERSDGRTGALTSIERWDVITSAAVAIRAAIEKYIARSQQQNAINAVAAALRADIPVKVTFREYETTMEVENDRK
jgi:hypothetical protein